MQDSKTIAAQRLRSGLQAMGIELDETQQQQLLIYLELLRKWNRAYNLTAVREPLDMVSRHLLDSLAVLPRVAELAQPGRPVLDVGTGPGLPGIPLAIALPEQPFVLLDSNGKKTRFLFQVQLAMKLDTIRVEQARIETFQMETAPSLIISRAFASLQQFVEQTRPLWSSDPELRLLAMKGEYPAAELAALPAGWHVAAQTRLEVPQLDAERHLIELVQNGQ